MAIRFLKKTMTYLEIIELTDAREPNHYDTAQKLRWLQALQERVEKEAGYVLRGTGDAEDADSHDQSADWSRNDKRFALADPFGVCHCEERSDAAIRSPFSFETEICVNYLIAQINAANGETERYNRAITLFNEMYAAYLSHLIRKSHGLKSTFSI